MATKLPNGKQQFINPVDGTPLAGGFVYHYVPGTSTAKDTYQDQAGIVLNTNPIVLDAYGQAVIWGNGSYRQVLFDADGGQIWDQTTASGISQAMDPVVGAATLTAARTAFGISAAVAPVLSQPTLALAMSTLGISATMQPVVGASTLAAARTALGVDAVGLEVYNVKAYGAVGDGVVNDTAAINAAIAACSSGIVYFPPGNYKVTSTLFMKPGVAFWGTTPTSSTITAGANNINIVGFVASALATGFEIRNLGLSGGGFTGCSGIYLDGVDATKRISIITVSNVYTALCANGVYLSFCANIVLDNIFANVCTNGMWLSNAADAVLVACKAQNGAGYGFIITGGPGAYDEGVRLLGCSTNGQAYGLGVVDQDWGCAVGCSFTTCTTLPIGLQNSDNWRIDTTEIAAAAAVVGMSVDANCNNVQVSNNFFALNTFGLVLQGSRHSVIGNKFVGDSNVDIYLQNATQVTVTGNGCDSATVPQSIVEVGTANYNSIGGNVTNGTVVVVGANSVTYGNVVY